MMPIEIITCDADKIDIHGDNKKSELTVPIEIDIRGADKTDIHGTDRNRYSW